MALDVNVLGQIDTHPPTSAYLNCLLDAGDRCDRTQKPVSDATTLTTASKKRARAASSYAFAVRGMGITNPTCT